MMRILTVFEYVYSISGYSHLLKVGGLSSPPVGISYKGCHYFAFGKNTLSQKIEGEGNGNTIVEFDALELEEGEEGTKPSQMEILLSTLKEKLEPKDYSELMTKLGIDEDISNAELLEAITALLAKKEEKPEGEEGEEEKDAADYKTFIKECMAEGKDLKTCSAEFKEKYPEPDKAPSKEEIAEVEQLVAAELAGKKKKEKGEEEEEEDEMGKRLAALETQLADLKKEKELAGMSAKVDELVKDKHMAPVQRDLALKLADGLAPEKQEELLEFFRTTQKFSVHQDVGILASGKPGAGGVDMTAERRQELIKLHGLQGLIDDKADKSKLPWERNN